MTIQQFVDKYNGKKVGRGECGDLVRAYWTEVDGTNPPSYDDSKDYWFNPVPGYDKITSNPIDGDIAIYNGHGVYTEGHSAICYEGVKFEQNADPDGSPAHLYPRPNTYLLGYLRKQGGGIVEPADYRTNDGDVRNIYQELLKRTPSDEEIKIYSGKPWKEVYYAIATSDEFKNISNGGAEATKLGPGLYSV